MDKSESFVEIPDPNANDYEPTDQEIREYAEWLGADLQNDKDLFWIAREALKAKIPPGWKLYQRKDGSGDPFYFNSDTGESLWDHPMDEHYKKLFAEEKEKKMNAQRNQSQYSMNQNSRPLASLGKAGPGQKTNTSISSTAPKSLLPMKQTVIPKTSLQNSPTQNNNYLQLQREKEELEAQLKIDMEVLRRKSRIEQENIIAQNQKEIEAIQNQHRQKLNELKQRVAQEESQYQDRLQSVTESKNKLNQEYSETVSKYSQLMQNAEDEYREQKRRAEREFNETIERMKEDNRREIERLKQVHEREVQRANDDNAVKETNNNYKNEIEDLKSKFAKEIADLKSEHEKNVKNLQEQNEDELEDIKQKHINEIQELNSKHAKELQEINAKHTKEMAKNDTEASITLDISDDSLLRDIQANKTDKSKLISQQDDEINKIKQEHEQKVKDLKSSNEKEIETIKSDHKKAIDSLKSDNEKEIEEIQSQIEDEKQKKLKELSEIKQKNKEEINKIKSDHEKEIETLEDEHEEQKSDLTRKFDSEIEKLTKQHQRKLNKRKQDLEDEEENEYEERTPKSSKRENQLKRELEALRDQYNAAVAAQENQKVQMEQAAQNHKLQLELLQAKFDVEKHQQEINHQREISNIKNSTPPSSPSMTMGQSWRRFASFQQFSRSPSEQKLKMSKSVTFTMRYLPDLTTINNIVANISPSIQASTPRSVQMYGDFMYHAPMSRMSEPVYQYPAPNTDKPRSPPPFEYASNLSEKLLKQMKGQQSKLERVREKFDASYGQLSSSMKEAIADVYSLINGYKNVIAEQNKSLSQLSVDFQQQTARMARNFRESVAEVESAYKMAMAINQPQINLSSPRSARRPKLQLQTPSGDFASEDSGEEAIRNFLVWRKQQKALRRQKYED